LSADDVVGPIVLKAESKDVNLNSYSDSLELSVERGDIALRPGRLPLGRMDVRTRAGNVNLDLPAGAKFEIEAVTGKGEVENDYGDSLKVDSEGKGGKLTGKAGSGGPEIKIHSNRGHVVVSKSDVLPPPPPPPPATPNAPKAQPAPPPPGKVESL
jgi:DUF4097 and DUF4098 domain-containing protein YvlB